MQKILKFFSQDGRESKTKTFSPVKKQKSVPKQNLKDGQRIENKKEVSDMKPAANKDAARRRWKLIRNICFAFRVGRRQDSPEVLLLIMGVQKHCQRHNRPEVFWCFLELQTAISGGRLQQRRLC